MTAHWLFLAGACMFFSSRDVAAQDSTPHKVRVDSISTKNGVYTAEQARRGRNLYAGNCRSCHTPESHTGATFHAVWDKRSLAELYSYIRERMPKNDPGTLSAEEYADVLAYLLRMNGMPPGQVELPADSTTLRGIRIETMKSP